MHPLRQSAKKQNCVCFVVVQNNDNLSRNKNENKKGKKRNGCPAAATTLETNQPNKVFHWLKETLQLINSQTRLLTGTIGTDLADGLFYSWIVT